MTISKILYLPALLFILSLMLVSTASSEESQTYVLQQEDQLFGAVQRTLITGNEQNLIELARDHGLGYDEIRRANPGIDPWYASIGTEVVLPTSWLLPGLDQCLANAPGPYLTVQIGSFRNPEMAWGYYRAFLERTAPEERHYLRYEKIGPFYTVRSGLFIDWEEANLYHAGIVEKFSDATLVNTHIKPGTMLYPLTMETPPAMTPPTREPVSIVVNLAEFRLYRITWKTDGLEVRSFPVGIGREGSETVRGRYPVIEKMIDAPWIIPTSLLEAYPQYENGVIPAGPENPLGRFALRLSHPEYLIHGTNRPLGIGRRVSHGCIRMYNDDIEALHALTESGDEVIILYQPIKIGEKDNVPYIEVHGDYLNGGNLARKVMEDLNQRGWMNKIDLSLLFKALEEKSGIPVRIGVQE
ncbi:L,D-transpeptidase family protein [Thermodesulfobacteriota bacterium]